MFQILFQSPELLRLERLRFEERVAISIRLAESDIESQT